MVDVVKKYNVSVFGENYILLSDEPEDHVFSAAALVDKAMRDIAKKIQIIQPNKVAVLVAIQLASELINKRKDLDSVNNIGMQLLEQIDRQINI